MSDNKKPTVQEYAGFLDRLWGVYTHFHKYKHDYKPLPSEEKDLFFKDDAMFTEIKGIVTSYPIILKALEEANENIDNFIKSKQPPEVPDDLVDKAYCEILSCISVVGDAYIEDDEDDIKAILCKLLQSRQPDKTQQYYKGYEDGQNDARDASD